MTYEDTIMPERSKGPTDICAACFLIYLHFPDDGITVNNGLDVEGSGRDLIESTILEIAWRN
jgi:hypothetical protein